MTTFNIRHATSEDVPTILEFILGLAEYENLRHEVVTDEALLHQHLFGETPRAEVILLSEEDYDRAEPGNEAPAEAPKSKSRSKDVGFALFFHNYSTFRGQPGIYLEDLFVLPEARGKGYGEALLAHLAQLAIERDCARLDWVVLDWNEPAIGFYRRLGAKPLEDWRVFRLTGQALSHLAGEGQDRDPQR